jgi:hypothetical protein
MWCSGSYEHIYLTFNLILARCGMYVGMGMSFVGRGEWTVRGGGNRKSRTWNCETMREGGIGKAEQTLISSRDIKTK